MQNVGEHIDQVQNQAVVDELLNNTQEQNYDTNPEYVDEDIHASDVEDSSDEISDEPQQGQDEELHKKHFRKLEKKLKKENYKLSSQLLNTQQQLQQYAELFNATYANGVNGGQPQTQEDEVTAKVKAILQREQAQKEQFALQEKEALVNHNFQKNLEEVSNKYDDFEEAINNPDLRISQSSAQRMVNIVRYFPHAGDVIYNLVKNPTELNRIASLDPHSQAAELASFALKLGNNPAPKSTGDKTIRPVNGGNFKSAPGTSANLASMSYEQMKAYKKSNTKR